MYCTICGTNQADEICEACQEALEPTQAEVEQLLDELDEVLED